jgi:lysyl-tRNA synthetase class 2
MLTISAITGIPYRTSRGELSILASQLPTLLAPNLHKLPIEFTNKEAKTKLPHVDLLVNEQGIDILRLRSHVVQYLRSFFLSQDFLEVETPIISGKADGAVAKSFKTTATEFAGRNLSLRIAPEIWLKRLILGGMDRVFEIGPSFRNEGLDATHNPEFTTCEFYKTYADLEDVIDMTEKLLSGLAKHVEGLKSSRFTSLPSLTHSFSTPFQRIQFIPALEAAINQTLPELSSPEALSILLQTLEKLQISVPESSSNLPHLLDVLFSHFVEPGLTEPTFVTHHPACLSPLAKTFCDPGTNQEVSARVELYVDGRELVNAYEEENSPFEQRRKFLEQAAYAGREDGDGSSGNINESYLKALEWGLPPTGGWGCGIDRLCMLFSGAPRIENVRAFGNLRHVVGLGREDDHG